MMDFANYRYLAYVLLAGAIILAFYAAYLGWKRRVLRSLAPRADMRAALLAGSPIVRALKTVMIALCVVLFSVAVLRPRWGETMRESRNEGVDLLVALDVSRSMLARDVPPSRLERAKDAVRLMANSLGGGRTGMILFAGDAFLQCPLTEDAGAFMMFLDSAGVGSVRRQGTDIGRALEAAEKVFAAKRMTSKMLVLITDGEDHEGRAVDEARRLRKLGVSVHTVGIGTATGGAVPLDERSDEYLRDDGGGTIISGKNSAVLERIARETGGEHLDITADLSDIYRLIRLVGDQDKLSHGSRIVKEKVERFQLFVLVLIVLLSLELMIPERPRVPRFGRPGRADRSRRGSIWAAPVVALAVCMFFISWIDPYRDEVREGNRLFGEKDYQGAGERYRTAEKYAPREKDRDRLRFNHGDVRYMQGDYDGALDHFRGSLRSGDPDVQKKALFNAGNAYLKKGDYRAAVGAYIDALKIDPEYLPAKKNLEYMLRMNKKNQDGRGDTGNQDDRREKDGHRDGDGRGRPDGDSRPDGSASKKAGGRISAEQVRNLLESMKNKPVRREKGTGDGRRELDKQW
ncbi:MAG TPA: VWA domain-containing protein [Spirochaetota bacterium]|nr:VWA domain-containing protein [Spirochaetota bacterium]